MVTCWCAVRCARTRCRARRCAWAGTEAGAGAVVAGAAAAGGGVTGAGVGVALAGSGVAAACSGVSTGAAAGAGVLAATGVSVGQPPARTVRRPGPREPPGRALRPGPESPARARERWCRAGCRWDFRAGPRRLALPVRRRRRAESRRSGSRRASGDGCPPTPARAPAPRPAAPRRSRPPLHAPAPSATAPARRRPAVAGREHSRSPALGRAAGPCPTASTCERAREPRSALTRHTASRPTGPPRATSPTPYAASCTFVKRQPNARRPSKTCPASAQAGRDHVPTGCYTSPGGPRSPGRRAKLHLHSTSPWASELAAAFAQLKTLAATAGYRSRRSRGQLTLPGAPSAEAKRARVRARSRARQPNPPSISRSRPAPSGSHRSTHTERRLRTASHDSG